MIQIAHKNSYGESLVCSYSEINGRGGNLMEFGNNLYSTREYSLCPRPESDFYHSTNNRSCPAPHLCQGLRCCGRRKSHRLLGRSKNFPAHIPKHLDSKPCSRISRVYQFQVRCSCRLLDMPLHKLQSHFRT